MRLILAGSPAARRRLRERLVGLPVDVIAEFPTLAAAHRSGLAADAILLPAGGAAGDRDRAALEEPLTPRETQVLELLSEGLSNKAIADRLGISDQTVKFHVASLLGKLGAANRTDAVRLGVRRGLIAL